MKVSDNTYKILATLSFKGIGKGWVYQRRVWEIEQKTLFSLISEKTKLDLGETIFQYEDYYENAKKLVASYEGIADGIVAMGDESFPECRGKVKDSDQPLVLAYRGDISLLGKQNKNIAVIGVLNPTPDIEQRERNIVSQLVRKDCVIVSGLALGCDFISHSETLRRNGKTVAILPTTLKNIQPAANRELAWQIVENGGLLVTEYLNEALSRQNFISRFIERDRLQAYFSDCVLLAASYAPNNQGLDCGSRHALAKAKEAGIKRAVMYSYETDLNDSMFDLNRIILTEDRKDAIIITEQNVDSFVRQIYPAEKLIENRLF